MRRPSNRRVVTLVALVVLASACVAWWLARRDPPHLAAAKRHLVAQSFESAEAELRLALQDRGDDASLKAFLAYAILRQELADSEDQELDASLLAAIYGYYTLAFLKEHTDDLSLPYSRTEIKDALAETERQLIDVFRRHRIPFREWSEVRNGITSVAEWLASSHLDPGDRIGNTLKDASHAFLAARGDVSAARRLIAAAAIKPNLLALTVMAPQTMRTVLEEETRRSGSFLTRETTEALRLVVAIDAIREFATSGSFRPLRRQDIPEGQMELVGDKATLYLFDGEGLFLCKLTALVGASTDPGVIRVQMLTAGDHWLLLLSGYDGKSGLNRCRPYLWKGGRLAQMNVVRGSSRSSGLPEEVRHKLPFAEEARYVPDEQMLLVPVRRMGTVNRTRKETAYLTLRSYRREMRYNPRLYRRWGYYYGGYEYVRVPVVESLPYERQVRYKERVAGNEWHLFAFDWDAPSLKWVHTLWLPDGSTPVVRAGKVRRDQTGEDSAQAAAPEPSKPDTELSPPPAPEAGTDEIDVLSAAAALRPLEVAEVRGLSSSQRRLLRNAIFARHGYAFASADLRTYFAAKSWYRARVSDMNAVYASLSSSEKVSIETIKALE